MVLRTNVGDPACASIAFSPWHFASSVGNLKPASTFALDHNLTVLRAQFDLPNVTASRIYFFGRSAGRASGSRGLCTAKHIFAVVDANSRRRGVKVWLKHKRTMRFDGGRFKAHCPCLPTTRATRDTGA
jgi:hypothetical protein